MIILHSGNQWQNFPPAIKGLLAEFVSFVLQFEVRAGIMSFQSVICRGGGTRLSVQLSSGCIIVGCEKRTPAIAVDTSDEEENTR